VNFNWVVQKGFLQCLRNPLNLRGLNSRLQVVRRLQFLDRLSCSMMRMRPVNETIGKVKLITELGHQLFSGPLAQKAF
jgi:hypothetical protein